MTTTTNYADNIRSTLERATQEDVHQGVSWYSTAHTFSVGLARKYGLTVRQAAAIVAALSPRLGWGDNQRYADHLARYGGCMGPLGANVRKAAAIRNGADPRTVFGFDNARNVRKGQGSKVRSFYLNVLDPKHSQDVTVDGHAAAIAGADPKVLARVGGYESIAEAYRTVAAEVGLAPHEVQAITWTTHRRTIGADRYDNYRGKGA